MKKVLIVGEFFSENLGDGIICGIVRNFFSNYYDVSVLDLSGRINFVDRSNVSYEFSLLNEEKKYIKYNIKKTLYKLGYKKTGKNISSIINKFKKQFDSTVSAENFEAIIFAGGQMFIDTFINQIEYICDYASALNTKVIFNACGIGNMLQKDKLIKVLNSECVEYVSLRDGVESVKKIIKYHLFDTYDVAILAGSIYEKNGIKYKLGIGIMLSSKHSVRKQIRFWVQFLEKLKTNMIDFKVFTNGSYTDQCFAGFVIGQAGFSIEEILLEKPNYPEELISIITSFDSIISMRLHSLIMAYSYDVPALAISWDDKVREFFIKIDRQDICYDLYSEELMEVRKIINYGKRKYDKVLKKKIISEIQDNLSNIVNKIETKR